MFLYSQFFVVINITSTVNRVIFYDFEIVTARHYIL